MWYIYTIDVDSRPSAVVARAEARANTGGNTGLSTNNTNVAKISFWMFFYDVMRVTDIWYEHAIKLKEDLTTPLISNEQSINKI